MKISETHLERAAEAAAQGGGEKQSGLRGSFASCIAPHISENRHACIAKGAYFYAKYRGFAPGHELDDWLAAENDVDQRLAGESHVF
jgi:hypothetical protein